MSDTSQQMVRTYAVQTNAERFICAHKCYLSGGVGGYVALLITNIMQHNNTTAKQVTQQVSSFHLRPSAHPDRSANWPENLPS